MMQASELSSYVGGFGAVIKHSRIFKDYQESGAMNALVNVHAAIDERTFLTKSGDLLMALSARGVDYECLDPVQLGQTARRFESALRNFDENFRIYQYLLKHDSPTLPHRAYDNPVVQEAIHNRIAYLQGKADNLYSLETYFAVVYQGWRQAGHSSAKLATFLREPLTTIRQMLSTEAEITVLSEELDRAREVLTNKVMSFVVQLQDSIHVDVLDKQQAFRFLRQLLNYAPYKVDGARLKYDSFVDFQVCNSALECYQDHLRLDDSYVEVLTLKEPPAQTFAHLLRGLQEIPCNYVIASEWKRENNLTIRKLIQSKRRHFHNSKSSKIMRPSS